MSWAYQLVRHTEKKSGRIWYGVHEVYYTDAGRPWTMTEDPIPLEGDSVKDLHRNLRLIRHDLARRPILDAQRIRWARAPWGAHEPHKRVHQDYKKLLRTLGLSSSQPRVRRKRQHAS